MKIKIALIFCAVILMASCKSNSDKNSEGDKSQNKDTIAQEKQTNDKDAEKTSGEKIVEKHWKLIKLEGQDVEMADNQERERFFILKNKDNRVQGFAGCNNFSGEYSLEKGMRLKFSKVASTMKACPDVDVDEAALMKVFEQTDNYTVHNDTLSLNVGRRAPLAMFKAVYMD